MIYIWWDPESWHNASPSLQENAELVHLHHYGHDDIITTIYRNLKNLKEDIQKTPKIDKHMLTKWSFPIT